MKTEQTMTSDITSDQAIEIINSVWGAGRAFHLGSLTALVRVIKYAAFVLNDPKARNWIFLMNWEPQQHRN